MSNSTATDPEVWAYSTSGTKVHAFVDNDGAGKKRAMCSRGIVRPSDARFSTAAKMKNHPYCNRCVLRLADRLASGEFEEDGGFFETVDDALDDMATLQAEALDENAVREAAAAGVRVGGKWKPGPGYRFVHHRERVVTVERIWAGSGGHTGISYSIWEPGYQGAPGQWGSTHPLEIFLKMYEPRGFPAPAEPEFSDEVVQALRTLRNGIMRDIPRHLLADAVDTLDNAGVFAGIDEQADYDTDPAPVKRWKWQAKVRWIDDDAFITDRRGMVEARTYDGAYEAALKQHIDPETYLSGLEIVEVER